MKWPFLLLAGVLLVAIGEATRRAIGYVRGQAVDLVLTSIGNGHWLESQAAEAFKAMRAAALAQGVALVVNSSFREMAQQQAWYAEWLRGVRADLVAVPGTSLHQSGRAVDLDTDRGTSAAFTWLTLNAARFGFRRTVSSEPWHWEFA